MSSRTMVFGDDGSPSADLAWLWINTHAWPGWRLELIHATDPAVVTAAAESPEPRTSTVDSPANVVAHAIEHSVLIAAAPLSP